MIGVLLTSPKNAREIWNSDCVTTLLRLDLSVHCLSIDSNKKKYDGGNYFVACGALCPSSLGPDACNVGTDFKASRRRVEL
jgi:hypothetical protein